MAGYGKYAVAKHREFCDELGSYKLLKHVSAPCSVLNQNPSHPSMLNHMLPFRAHFPSRYQLNAIKVAVGTAARGNKSQAPGHLGN